MPTTYAYKVRDKQGKMLEGTLDADSTTLVANRLRQMGYVPISIDKKSVGMSTEIKIPGFGGKVKLKDVAIFCRQFATMISSGVQLLRALAILEQQTENKALAEIVREVRVDVEKGSSPTQAFGRHPKAFNALFVSMVKAGETGGILEGILLRLAETIEKQVELKGKIKSALTYPVAVFALVILIVAAMLLFIVPTFTTLYEGLGGQLPLPTRLLIAVSSILTHYFIFVMLFWGVTIFLLKRFIKTPRGRDVKDRIVLKIPLFGKLIHKTAIVRFARTLSVLQTAGVPILESLEITSDTCNNTVIARAITDIQESVRVGEGIGKTMAGHAIFPPMVTHMTSVGEETGALPEMLGKVADFYEQEVEAMVDALTSLLEPLMIVVLGGAVGGMVVALYMPMFNIINLIE
ncbi:MAG TPA: type II secretion system F family protein [Acidimicrobiales bacterium]|nr:type II secretion system F family protein [Acidimicrobiales bacterium]